MKSRKTKQYSRVSLNATTTEEKKKILQRNQNA